MSSPIRVCLVGAGRAGKVHANSLAHHLPGARLAAMVDPVAEVRQSAGEEFGIAAEARFELWKRRSTRSSSTRW